MIGTTVSHYKITEKIGGGGMGVVYKAQDLKLDRTVALKFLPSELTLDPEAKSRFVHEAKAASALQHNNICTVHDIDEADDGKLFIVMDSYEGETLKKRIERGSLKIDEAIDIAIQIAQGLQEAHKHQIVHRDVKPANILITSSGVVKIVDFGLAKLAGRTTLTKAGSAMGTVAYMSPEQARGEPVDQRTDIWSLGVVLYEMLSGQRPFTSEYDQALVYAVVNEEPKALTSLRSDVPAQLGLIVQKAMAKEPEERYQNIGELLADIEAKRVGTGMAKRSGTLQTRKRRIWYSIALAATVLAAVLIFYTSSRGEIYDSIAVLLFDNLSKDSTQLFFSQGLTEEVIDKLWQVGSLRVPSLKSVVAKVKPGMTYADIAHELGVKAVLDAPVLCVGNKVRITARLMDPATDKPLWSETYEREIGDVLSLQAELARAIVRQVRVTLTPQERDRLARAQAKVDPRAYELYLRALSMKTNMTSEEDWKKATGLLQEAIAIDSTYAPYHALLAHFRCGEALEAFVSPDEGMRRAEEELCKALSLDSLNIEALNSLGVVRKYQWRLKESAEAYQRVLKLNPGNAWILLDYAMLLTLQGNFDESVRLSQRARLIDPSVDPARIWMSSCYFYAQRFDDAEREALEGLKEYPNGIWLHNVLAIIYARKGMKEESVSEIEKTLALEIHEEHPELILNIGISYAFLGMTDKAQAVIERYLAARRGKPVSAYMIACVYGAMGKANESFQWLERAYLKRDPMIPAIKVDPPLDRLRSDPRFAAMLKKVGMEG